MWKTYAVKTIYRTSVEGEPYAIDDNYSDKYDLIEERIVTFKARSFDEAVSRAEREAEEYSDRSHINPYGQEVYCEYIGFANAYDPFDSVPANIEVYSNTLLVIKTIGDEELFDNINGKELENEKGLRKNFLNVEFNGYVT